MVEIKKIPFSALKKDWNRLYAAGKNLPPYMDYAFQKVYKKYLWVSFNRIGFRYLCYAAVKDGEIICIIPVIQRKGKRYLGGDWSPTGHLDFVYSQDVAEETLQEVVTALKKTIGSLRINKLPEGSKLNQLLSRTYKCADTPQTCVNIPFGDDYDAYFACLSKSVRQNNRTAKNRLTREGKTFRVETFVGGGESKAYTKQAYRIYTDRANARYHHNMKPWEVFIKEYFQAVSLSLQKSDNRMWSFLFIDDEMAGFMGGFTTVDGTRAVIPRLAINGKYSLYCPGNLLIAETVRNLIETTSVRNLDLSRGDETYKYSMGGVPYGNWEYEL
ncbi:MAG: GNAT family N-acetyltransferase [Oscillospiraceae bacterium]|nr:GNAT family N-acetyltransferase [Oscillospiraceae bacterium]